MGHSGQDISGSVPNGRTNPAQLTHCSIILVVLRLEDARTEKLGLDDVTARRTHGTRKFLGAERILGARMLTEPRPDRRSRVRAMGRPLLVLEM